MSSKPRFSDYVVFTDESGTRERFLIYGALYVPAEFAPAVEEWLEEFCRRNGFGAREVSWKKCSRAETSRYAVFTSQFWEMNAAVVPMDFRSLVVDTKANPVWHPSYVSTREEGFYKFYHHFLCKSTEKAAWFGQRFLIYVGDTTDSYGHRTEILEKTVNGALRKAVAANFERVEVVRQAPRMSRTHQLADVLLGAVSYTENRAATAPNHKGAICAAMEARIGRSLSRDFKPTERPFNIWRFAARGNRRWGAGSSGYVR
jgi:hypothetical protein